jgi:hypothetical protein
LRRGILSFALLVILVSWSSGASASPKVDCGSFDTSTCGVTADPHEGQFHGLIAVSGVPSVLELSARSGTKAGCGDCEWTLIAACPENNPGDPGAAKVCAGAIDAPTWRGGVLERLYLSDADIEYRLMDTLCLHPADTVIGIGDRAAADVQRYLRDVTPPDLVIDTHPHAATLAGLPTRFHASTPVALHPTPFGTGQITETITITPIRSTWSFGDTTHTGWVPTDAVQTHRYLTGGVDRGGLITRWGATYTITFDTATYGPYDAVGQLTRQQGFTLPVHTASPHLTSQ